jgi:hypothetical protein
VSCTVESEGGRMSKLPGNEDHGATECDTSPEENYCTMSNHRLVLRLAANLTLKKRDSNQLRINFLKLPFLGFFVGTESLCNNDLI